jgi:hypothetical protein
MAGADAGVPALRRKLHPALSQEIEFFFEPELLLLHQAELQIVDRRMRHLRSNCGIEVAVTRIQFADSRFKRHWPYSVV